MEKNSSASASASSSASGSASASATLRIRYGRLVLAAFGVVLLASAVVSAPFAIAGVVSGAFPTLFLLLGIASAAVLRGQVVRERQAKAARRAEALSRRRADEARRRLKAQSPSADGAPEATANRRPFDAEAGGRPDQGPAPLTAAELREAALAVAAAAGDTPKPESSAARGSAWQPVDVPKPTYVEAPKAERPAPEPLELPEAPKPTSKTSIRQDAATSSTDARTDIRPAADARPNTGRINLDDVLQRRRA